MSRNIAQGTTIERYRVERLIGSGSMGDVFLGMDLGLDRNVALKILNERHRDNRELRARFVREAKAVAAIAHPNVVQVFTTGTFDGRPYIAMEFLDGTDLGTSVDQTGPWSSHQCVNAVIDVARGLDAAAKAGLIHRDVKPSNLVLLHDGTVKVTDFGLAKPMDSGDQPALTALGVVVGTPDYIAPEQARGETIDHRVDIYALGGTLYFLLTGMPPFRTGNAHQDKYLRVVARHLKNPPPDATERNPTVDRQLSRLVQHMMSKNPDERPDYPSLIKQLEAMSQRLERETGPMVSLGNKHRDSTADARVSPTPVVGARPEANDTVVMANAGDSPAQRPGHLVGDLAGDPEDALRTNVRMRSSERAPMSRATPHAGHLDAARARQGSAPVISQAPTSTSASTSASPMIVTSALPRWLWLVTIGCVLVFAVGLALRIVGPLPEAPANAVETPMSLSASDRAATTSPSESTDHEPKAPSAGDDVGQSKPNAAPPGTLFIEPADGSPSFYIDARPVSYRAYAAIFPQHDKSADKGANDDAPVTGVSYAYARSYGDANGKSLPTAEQWRAAAKTPGFESHADAWEWAREAAGDASTDPDRAMVSVISTSGTAQRPVRGANDVTFRLVVMADKP